MSAIPFQKVGPEEDREEFVSNAEQLQKDHLFSLARFRSEEVFENHINSFYRLMEKTNMAKAVVQITTEVFCAANFTIFGWGQYKKIECDCALFIPDNGGDRLCDSRSDSGACRCGTAIRSVLGDEKAFSVIEAGKHVGYDDGECLKSGREK